MIVVSDNPSALLIKSEMHPAAHVLGTYDDMLLYSADLHTTANARTHC